MCLRCGLVTSSTSGEIVKAKLCPSFSSCQYSLPFFHASMMRKNSVTRQYPSIKRPMSSKPLRWRQIYKLDETRSKISKEDFGRDWPQRTSLPPYFLSTLDDDDSCVGFAVLGTRVCRTRKRGNVWLWAFESACPPYVPSPRDSIFCSFCSLFSGYYS